MFVLVYGERVEVPAGCAIVAAGKVQSGDMFLRIFPRSSWVPFAEGDVGMEIVRTLVIRRDPGAEG